MNTKGHGLTDDPIGTPYRFIRHRPLKTELEDGTKITSHSLEVYFDNPTDRKRFAEAVKKAVRARGVYSTRHMR